MERSSLILAAGVESRLKLIDLQLPLSPLSSSRIQLTPAAPTCPRKQGRSNRVAALIVSERRRSGNKQWRSDEPPPRRKHACTVSQATIKSLNCFQQLSKHRQLIDGADRAKRREKNSFQRLKETAFKLTGELQCTCTTCVWRCAGQKIPNSCRFRCFQRGAEQSSRHFPVPLEADERRKNEGVLFI
ncbi:uncharacterized protein V6R79_020809 [Siganus canaliculatus]